MNAATNNQNHLRNNNALSALTLIRPRVTNINLLLRPRRGAGFKFNPNNASRSTAPPA